MNSVAKDSLISPDQNAPWRLNYSPLDGGKFRLHIVRANGSPILDAAGSTLFAAATTAGPFSRAAKRYRAAGWLGTLPLPAGAKNPPPSGYTGHGAPHPDDKRIARWRAERARAQANIALRLAGVEIGDGTTADQFEIVGIDVDHYIKGVGPKAKVKRGGDQLAKLETKYGTLPDTWTSSARTDGVSGIRYFLVPAGLKFRGQVDKDIECIYRGYRFAVVWPSTNPDHDDCLYWWFPPGAALTEDGRANWNPDTDALPEAHTLPVLPDAWIDYLTNGRMRSDDSAANMDTDSSVAELREWADDTFNDSAGQCARVAKSVADLKAEITSEATSHDKIIKAHWHLYQLAAEGHTGWKSAIGEIEAHWAAEVIERDKRSRSEIDGEVFRSKSKALRKIKGQVQRNVGLGARAVAEQCPCIPILPGEPDPDFADDVATEARKLRVREAARRLNSRHGWTEPDDQGDLAHQIDNPEPDPGFLVDQLIPARAFVMINAQYKVGKSTLVSVNLTRALVTGEPFLGSFPTALAADETVAIWNLEVDKATLTGWFEKTDIDRDAQARVFPMCLRGNRAIDFDNDEAIDWTVRWLSEHGVAVWIIDPLSKLYRGDDESNHEFNQWWLRVEDIAARAGVRVVVMVHHTGHSESAADRARGASAMMGNADVLMTYRHDGKHGALPKSTKRYLSAFGRNVDKPEFEIDYDAGSGRLNATSSGVTRADAHRVATDAQRRGRAVALWTYLKARPAGADPVNKTALLAAMQWPTKGRAATESSAAIELATAQGWVIETVSGVSKLYETGPKMPAEARVVDVDGKDENGL